MKHFLLTRWNLPGALDRQKYERTIHDPEWLRARRRLFEGYCLPSVKAQTAEDFIWLVLVHSPRTSETDSTWLRRCDKRIQLVQVDDPDSDGAAEVRQAVGGLLATETWVITTRVDSDDMLHREHLAKVRSVHSGVRTFVQFLRGYYYDVRVDALCSVEEDLNAFLTLIEPAEGLETILTWSHTKIRQAGDVLTLDEVGWLALVHDRNALNVLIGDPVLGNEKEIALQDFGLRSGAGRLQLALRRLKLVPGVPRASGRE